MRIRFALPGMAIAALVIAGSASATPADDRWMGWIGCWSAEAATEGEMLCIVPDGEGVRMVSIANGKVVEESRVFADATARPVSEGGCEGTETAQWSSDGQRVYTRADLTCGTSIPRRVSSILAMVTPSQWLNVQSIGAGDQATARTIRYTAVEASRAPADIANLITRNALARETVRHAATAPLDLDDVREASRLVDQRAVEALLLVRNQPFDVDAKALVALDRDGVQASVIDAIVAVSHPERFAIVNEPQTAGRYTPDDLRQVGTAGMYNTRMCSSWYGAYNPWLDPFAYADDCYGMSSLSYLGMSRYGNRYSSGGFGWGYRPVIVIRDPNGEDPDAEPARKGTVSRNGYRSGSDRSGSAQSRSGSSSSGSSVGTSRASGTTGSSVTEKSGSGSTTTTGRTAKPRGSGGQ